MIKRPSTTLSGIVLFLAATGAAAATNPPAPPTSSRLASGSLTTVTGAPAGSATITAGPGNPILRIKVSGLPAGIHGVHIHTAGKCESPGFTSAGGHLNPGGRQHGKDNPAGSHLGDLPNLTVDGHGNGELVQALSVDAATLHTQLLDADGAALVVHADADDYHTDPSGNSGARIACAVLKAS
jgi:Cu-Zn family superoxide dismutase